VEKQKKWTGPDLVPAPPQKPVDLQFPLQVEHQFAALFAPILSDMAQHLVERHPEPFALAWFWFAAHYEIG
jgi:hypothetical protein